jgi:hypothetical protein
MTDPNTIPVNRHALISVGYKANPVDLERTARYLYSNYHIALNVGIYGDGVLIEGHDVAGWTLESQLARLASGLLFGHEVFYCSSCSSHEHNIGDCPEETLVYAVKVNGEDYMLVAHDLDGLGLMVGTHAGYGQCENCGGFGTLYSTSEEPKDFTIRFDQPTPAAICDGCGLSYPIVLKRSKEVCF